MMMILCHFNLTDESLLVLVRVVLGIDILNRDAAFNRRTLVLPTYLFG